MKCSYGAAQWRLRADIDHGRRERAERVMLRVISWSFLALALYVAADSLTSLWFRQQPKRSVLGTLILVLSVVIMPVLARANAESHAHWEARRSRRTRRRRRHVPICR